MDYVIKTLSQLRPILLGFRRSAGLTQAVLAERLGIAQQSYAQLEANPAAASVERLFKVMRLLNVELHLSFTPTSSKPGIEPPSAGTVNRQRPVVAAKKTKPSSSIKGSGRTQNVATSKRPARAVKIKKKREDW